MKTQADQARSAAERDAGFTLMEQVISMTLLFSVLLGLLLTLGAGARGIANGRQRTVATSLAKQRIEHLQGSAYTDIAMNLSSTGLSSDPYITGTSPNLKFEGENLVGGSTTPYKTVTTEAGATYTERTFITSVTPASGSAYRRITVIIEWTPSTSGNAHSMRFSSLAYPLDYTSYPAGSGLAEATGASVAVTGNPASFGSETYDDLHLALPAARAETSSSTLRTAHGAASSATGVIDVAQGPLVSLACSISGTTNDSASCPVSSSDDVADNDAGSQTGNVSKTEAASFGAATVSTPGGLTITTPAGSTTSRASTDACSACGFGDADGLPWAYGAVAATTGSAAAFVPPTGGLTGALWQLSSGWSASATTDHDAATASVVTSQAQLQAPALNVMKIDDAPGFTAAVIVPAFNASVTAYAGYTSSAPARTASAIAVQIWNGAGYQTFNVTPGVEFDSGAIAASPLIIGDNSIQLTSQVTSQTSVSSSAGTSPKTESEAQYPSLMIVTVDVVVTSISTGLPTSAFTVTFDYGRVSASSTWVVK